MKNLLEEKINRRYDKGGKVKKINEGEEREI